jgi:potassium-transporting ATPase KdpC subunit
MSMLRPALVSFAALTIITGLAYPFAITGIGQAVFHGKANGSLIVKNGQVVGSRLIGQHTEDPKYFWGRLSATGDYPTNAANSGGSNLAPSNPDLQKAAAKRIQALKAADPTSTTPVPADLVTASGSGLDPHITPAAADYQILRVALARGLTEARLHKLVQAHTEGRTFGVLGEPRVNVLDLNLALDALRP